MNILITGGAGFIGSHTADALLARGDSVRVLDALDAQVHGQRGDFPSYMNPAAELARADIRDLDTVVRALADIDAVCHFAAQTGVGQSMYAIRDYVDVNCTGTATLLEALLKARGRVRRLVLASSRAVYGEGAYACALHGNVSPGPRSAERLAAADFAPVCPICLGRLEHRPTSEDRVPQPASVYGWTKVQQEQLCRHSSEVLGLETVILRYFNVIGSRQSLANPYTGIATTFFARIESGRPVQLYEGGAPVRDFVAVGDVVKANLLALDARLPVRCVELNIGSGRGTTIRNFAEEIAVACGRSAALEATTQYRVGDIYACIADLGRARSVIGYEPGVELTAAVSEFVGWAREQDAGAADAERAQRELARYGLLGRGA